MTSLDKSTLVKKVDGFEIYFTPEVEYESIQDLLPDDTPARIRGLQRRIDNGNAVVFCARVSAHKAGIELGCDYLGGCIYDSYEDFYVKYADDYFADMVDTAVSEARAIIEELDK